MAWVPTATSHHHHQAQQYPVLQYQPDYPPSTAMQMQHHGQAITNQPQPCPPGAVPGMGQAMAPMGGGPPGCPPGLEYLVMVDRLHVKQKPEILEAFTGFETANKYEVLNENGQRVFMALEDSGCCNRQCCGSSRSFDMKIMDNTQNEVMNLHRHLRCSTCWCPCCLQKVEVSAPPGTIIGHVEQNWSICQSELAIKDAGGRTVLKIVGPCCTCQCCCICCCRDVKFKVLTTSGKEVGVVAKKWSGFGKEMFTDADNFGISFPMDLDVNVKATVLAACFLVDFMFFEDSGNKKTADAPGMLG